MDHHDVMVSVRFVLAIVPTVRMLVGLDTQQGGADDKPMVDASPHRTLAVASFHRLVMNEAFKVIVYHFPHREFLRLVVVDLALRITGKQVLEAGRAVSIVVLLTSSRVWPVYTVGASEASAVLDTLICFPHSTRLASLFRTALASSVLDTLICFPNSTLLASLFQTALSTTVHETLICASQRNLLASMFQTASSPTVFDALACTSLSTLLASLFQTASSPSMRETLTYFATSTLLASLDITSLSFFDSALEHWLRIHFENDVLNMIKNCHIRCRYFFNGEITLNKTLTYPQQTTRAAPGTGQG